MANWKSIRRKIKDSKKTKKAVHDQAKLVVNKEKEILIQKFLAHPVTKEIKFGPASANISNTLGGYGNLYTFIGFREGDNPVQDVINLLNLIVKLKTIKPKSGNNTKYEMSVQYPSNEEFKINTPMPWESGRSWVLSVERGISGFGSYMYKRTEGSRSGQGIQAKKFGEGKEQKIRSGSFRNVKYMSEMIKEFYLNLKKEK